MQELAKLLPQTLEAVKANEQEQRLPNQQSNLAIPLMRDDVGKAKLSNILLQCFAALKVYGKEPEQLGSVNSMFQMILADFPFDKIYQAFVFYLRHNSGLPDPGDIAQIILRNNKPPFDKAVYVSMSKKHPDERTKDEWQYIHDYERFVISGKY